MGVTTLPVRENLCLHVEIFKLPSFPNCLRIHNSWPWQVWLALRCLTARFQQLADLGAALFLRSQRPHHGADGEKTGRSGQVPLRAHLFGRLLFLCGAHWICNVSW